MTRTPELDLTASPDAAYQPLAAEAVRITPPGRHFFFGYYDLCPWDAEGRYVLAAEAAFADRDVRPDDTLTLGTLDVQGSNRFTPFAVTRAWCWQMGCRMQWAGDGSERRVLFNSVGVDGGSSEYACLAHDLETGESQRLGHAVYSVAPSGEAAVSLDFDRLGELRPGYGYCAVPRHRPYASAPEDEGIYHLDLRHGSRRLVVSLRQLAELEPRPDANGPTHWVNHLLMNPAGDRCVFLHRYHPLDGGWVHRLCSMRPDGSDLRVLSPGYCVSHYGWRGERTLLASVYDDDRVRFAYFDVETGRTGNFAEPDLDRDGHCTFSPDGQWVLNDTYPDPDSRMCTLMLVHAETGKRTDLARFCAPPQSDGPIRCDLHPRWNRDGTQVCIDSWHEGFRAMYRLDVSHLVASSPPT